MHLLGRQGMTFGFTQGMENFSQGVTSPTLMPKNRSFLCLLKGGVPVPLCLLPPQVLTLADEIHSGQSSQKKF